MDDRIGQHSLWPRILIAELFLDSFFFASGRCILLAPLNWKASNENDDDEDERDDVVF